MTAKAKCPGCGDEEESLTSADRAYGEGALWRCMGCRGDFKIFDWLKADETRTLTDADVEAIASRVVELMKP